MESLKEFFVKGDDLSRIIARKDLSLYFLAYYCWQHPKFLREAREINKSLFKVRENILWAYAYCMIPKQDSFHWNKGYIRKGKSAELNLLEEKIKAKLKWSNREMRTNRSILSLDNNLEYFAKHFGLDNKQRKQVGLKEIEEPKFKKLGVRPKGILEWQNV